MTTAPAYVPRSAPRRRVGALDGLRGLAVTGVIVYHLNASWLPGGYLGVDVFFVVSGFLITGLLVDALSPGGPVWAHLRDFWTRRARRLVPALVGLIAVVAVLAALTAPDAVPQLRRDIPAALVFVANWSLLFQHQSYFQTMGRPPLLQHLWSLGVEEQFYLVWPWAVALMARYSRRPAQTLTWLAGSGTVASSALMAALYTAGHDASNVYYNTFTHASGLMIGSCAAALVRAQGARYRRWAPSSRARAGTAALVGLVLLAVFVPGNSAFAYRGGILLASVLAAVVVLVALRPGPLTQGLGMRPLRYLGARSYSLYLWHWPIICLTRPDVDVPISGAQLLVLRLALIGLASELSYRFVEEPFRTGRAQHTLAALRPTARSWALGSAGVGAVAVVALLAVSNPPPLPSSLAAGSTPAARVPLRPPVLTGKEGTTTSSATVPAGAPSATTISATTSSTTAPTTSSPPTSSPMDLPPVGEVVPGGGVPTTTPDRAAGPRGVTLSVPPSAHGGGASRPSSTLPPTTKPLASKTTAPTTTTVPRNPPPPAWHRRHYVLALGDSVLLASAQALERRLDNHVTVDAIVGRQVWQGERRLSQYRRVGDLNGLKAVVVDLGSNGPLKPSDVSDIMHICRGVPLLVFVNVRVPLPWQAETNASLAAVGKDPGVRVVNWFAATAKPGVLWPDAVHPNPKGQVLYADLVAQALGM